MAFRQIFVRTKIRKKQQETVVGQKLLQIQETFILDCIKKYITFDSIKKLKYLESPLSKKLFSFAGVHTHTHTHTQIYTHRPVRERFIIGERVTKTKPKRKSTSNGKYSSSIIFRNTSRFEFPVIEQLCFHSHSQKLKYIKI